MSYCDIELDEFNKPYHDNEWGIPIHDDRKQFEYLMMEVMQCGLSWTLMLKKREIIRFCFDNFDYDIIAEYDEEDIQRILIAGKATVTAEAAHEFASYGILLLGNESQTVGPENAPMEVHLILLGAEVILLEGIVLTNVEEGKYFLSAAPLNLAGCDGSPCRAFLIK